MLVNKEIGIVFDLDGVVTDTAKLHFKAWKREAKILNMNLTLEENDKLRGLNRQKTAKAIFKLNNRGVDESILEKFCERKNTYYKELLRTSLDKSFVLGDLLIELPKLKDAGYKLAVASSSHNAPTILDTLNLRRFFEGVVNPAKIVNHKPHPEMYLKACDILKIDPENIIGVEDAPAGVKGILAGKMTCIAVKWTTPKSQFEGAHYIVNDSKELTKEFFDKVVKERGI